MPRKHTKVVDPADMIMDLPDGLDLDTLGKEPPKAKPKAAPKRKATVTIKAAGAFIDAIESVSILFGHVPDEAERNAAVSGLLAAAKKSPAVASIIIGGQGAQEWGAIVVGLGGLVARIGLDAAVARNEGLTPVRDRVYMGTTLAYSVFGVGGPVDFSPLTSESEPEEQANAEVAPGGARGNHRANGFGEDLAGSTAAHLP